MALVPQPSPSSPVTGLINPAVKDAFWLVVEDCLIRCHRFDTLGAIQLARSARWAAETTPPGISGDVIYHSEPFYVACDIAGLEDIREQERLLGQHRSDYTAILKTHGW